MVDAIFDGAPVGLGYWDRDLKFRRVNEHLAAMTGIPAADHIGKQPAELLPSMPGLGQIVECLQRNGRQCRRVVGIDPAGCRHRVGMPTRPPP